MSCTTLNQAAIQLNVSVGSLPEGFCPATMQELANAIASRLIISPSTSFNNFAIGSTAPPSNVGPWLKDCLRWFVFDDATASYIPTLKGGFDTQEYHTASSTFVVPDFIYKLKVHCWGGGGGGSTVNSTGGGGAGGYACKIVDVTPGQAINYVVGAGGAAGAAGVSGGATTFLTLTANGGTGGAGANAFGSAGGTATGGDINISGGAGGTANAAASLGGPGGSSPLGGPGGQGSSPFSAAISNGKNPGGAGASDCTSGAGAGAGGGILIEY